MRGSSKSSDDTYVCGLEFRIASTSAITVRNSSFRHLLVEPINRSKKPPHQGAFSRLKDHSIRIPRKNFSTSGWLIIATKILFADLNVLLLSDISFRGTPLLAVNLLKHKINDEAVMSTTKSKCTALVTQQVKRHIHTLLPVPLR